VDPETIKKIAEEVARHSSFTWVFWVTQGIFTVAAATIGLYVGEYFKTRGKNYATKKDFDNLQRQLSDQTHLVEAIKSEVSQRDWSLREWKTLRRIKLEELLNKSHECIIYSEKVRQYSFFAKAPEILGKDPGDELDTIATLYFPELEKEVDAVLEPYNEMKERLYFFGVELARKSDNLDEYQKMIQRIFAELKPLSKKLFDARSALHDAARKLIKEIMDVAH
jgi:hypothetical protein